jgi:hypothetical protein
MGPDAAQGLFSIERGHNLVAFHRQEIADEFHAVRSIIGDQDQWCLAHGVQAYSF